MGCLSNVVLIWTVLGFVNPKFIRFKERFEYVYELKTDVDFQDVGKFKIAAKVSISFVPQIANVFLFLMYLRYYQYFKTMQ